MISPSIFPLAGQEHPRRHQTMDPSDSGSRTNRLRCHRFRDSSRCQIRRTRLPTAWEWNGLPLRASQTRRRRETLLWAVSCLLDFIQNLNRGLGLFVCNRTYSSNKKTNSDFSVRPFTQPSLILTSPLPSTPPTLESPPKMLTPATASVLAPLPSDLQAPSPRSSPTRTASTILKLLIFRNLFPLLLKPFLLLGKLFQFRQ